MKSIKGFKEEQAFLLEEKYEGVETPSFRADVVRLAQGEPLAYVIGWIPFLDSKIFLDSRPLIPRSETEFWVERAIAEMPQDKPIRVLDLFAGSGAIGIAILKHVPGAQVDFGEIDEAHFPTIEKNIQENRIDAARTKIIKTNVWNALSNSYDRVLANPPYLSKARKGRIEKSVLSHEPALALFSEDDGYEFISKTLQDLPRHLAPGGIAFVEHEPEHAARIKKEALALGLEAETRPDQYGLMRYTVFHAKPGADIL